MVCLFANAAIHVYLAPMHLREAPYIGASFLALSIACIALALALALFDNLLTWCSAGVVNLLGFVAFIASRTVGLPQIGDDIGNWSEPLGFPTLAVELLTVGFGAVVLHRTSHGGAWTGTPPDVAG
ncbi:hypothetical protein C6I20_08565 [Aeromicrobium sp. A1-2]|nr:hypothetical protein C6I20_08565 [Aeromicrobium sp. A1-2]